MRLSTTAAKIIFASTAVVLLVISYILFLQIKDLIDLQKQSTKTTFVKLKLQEVITGLKEAESAQRGFLLSNDSLFLQPYLGAHDSSKKRVNEVRAYIKEDPLQTRDLNILETHLAVRYRSFSHVLENYNDQNINAETRKMHLLRGKAALDSIHHYINRITGREDDIIVQRQKEQERYKLLTPLYAILLMLTAIGILVFSYAKIIEHLKKTRKLLAQLRKLNYKLKLKNYKLELYNKELDSLNYIASHDLKEPVRKILTYTHLIEQNESTILSDNDKKYFQKIKHSAIRMKDQLDDLMLYSQLNATEKSFQEVDLDIIIREAIQDLQPEIEKNNTSVHWSHLPVVKGIPFQLKQLFENLISNSINYKKEFIDPVIGIHSSIVSAKKINYKFYKESSHYTRIIYSDNGSGFHQATAEKAFAIFQKLHTNSKNSGTGIGLAICKKIVENHNGYITARSKEDTGTSFEIYLPVVSPEASS
ncbi:MAG TPA: CHASE3 domain-containing protein [Chitinophagaceae bacterium]